MKLYYVNFFIEERDSYTELTTFFQNFRPTEKKAQYKLVHLPWRQKFAGTAPSCLKVNDDWVLATHYFGFEIFLILDGEDITTRRRRGKRS